MATATSELPETSTPCRLPLANLRRPHTHLRRAVLRFRRELERAVLARGDGIGIYQAARIAYAATAMRQAMRIDFILANAGEPGNVAFREKAGGDSRAVVQTGLTHAEWLSYSDRLIKARESVARAIQDLGLDRPPDPWAVVFDAPPALAARQATNGTQTAPNHPASEGQSSNEAEIVPLNQSCAQETANSEGFRE
jgi:hypothetical protein